MSTASTFLLSLWSQSLGQVLLDMTPSSFCKLWSLVWCAHIKHEAVTLKVYAENCRTSSEKLKVRHGDEFLAVHILLQMNSTLD